ncbi:MAG: hypothetical protein HYV94_03875 [Candidatus Rokubacteria bacterium]|nr:hypothetical protein [Candidatus Rokubacteria bacterium]
MAPARRDDLLVALAALLPLALFVAREGRIAGAPGFPLDDSWIHLHFARNLAGGAGFVYNPGTPVAGSTAPLWTLALAAGAAVAGASLETAKTLGVACALGAALLTRRAALGFGAPPAVALVAAVALLWAGPMAWGALSGMEVTLAALLVAAALLAHARGRLAWSAGWAALAVLARPEALLLLPFLALARPLTRRRALTFTLVTLAALAPMILFSLWTAGTPYPATAAAKVEGGLLGWLGGVREPIARMLLLRSWEFLREWVGWLWMTHGLVPVLLVPALGLAWARGGSALGVPALVLLVHPLGMALLAPYRGPAFQEGRYSIHLLPLVFVALAAMARKTRPWALAAYLALALVPLVPAAGRYAWAVQNINAMQVHLGRWVATHLPQTARIAVNDVGAIAYFSRREVIDLMGLVTPEIIPYRREGESGVLRYIALTCPDHVIVFPAWFPQLTARADLLEPVYRVRLERNEVAGAAEMVVYRLRRCAV